MKIVGNDSSSQFVERNQKFTEFVTRRGPRSGRNPYDANNSEENPVYNAYTGVNGQVNKSIRRMPWHWEPKKDVISCEKLR